MNIINFFFNKDIKSNKEINQDNKCTVMEYIIILKLLIKKRNIDFDNNFYIDWVMYLKPNINHKIFKEINIKTHHESYLLEDFINKYNLKKKLFKLLDKSIIDKNTYVYLTFTKNKYNNSDVMNIVISIEKYNIFICTNYYLFIYNVPLNYLEEMKVKNITYNNFHNTSCYIYENNHGILMSDYIYSNGSQKILYFDLFKKIIHRQIIK